MRSFVHIDQSIGSVPSTVVTNLSTVDYGRGTEALFREKLPGLLDELRHRARVASITASSAIEGVQVPDARRAHSIIIGQAHHLRNRDEQEFAGYRDALDYLLQRAWQPLNTGLLLHLHRLLLGHTKTAGGSFKQHDNLVVDRTADGSFSTRFRPVSAAQTEFYVHELVERYRAATTEHRHHPVLLIGLFVLDLSIIHPFEDGNGRVCRALTNALLADAGYAIGRYVSLEQIIADSADDYYRALFDSTRDWHHDESDPWPWLTYFVGTLAAAYRVFDERAAAERGSASKQERVRSYVQRHAPLTFRIADVRIALPDISDQTIRLVLDQLRKEDVIAPGGVGRSAAWQRRVS